FPYTTLFRSCVRPDDRRHKQSTHQSFQPQPANSGTNSRRSSEAPFFPDLRAIAGERPHAGVIRLGDADAEARGRDAVLVAEADIFRRAAGATDINPARTAVGRQLLPRRIGPV